MRRTVWGYLAATWCSLLLLSALLALIGGDWRGSLACLAILGFTMPNYAKWRRRAQAPIVE